MKGHLRTRGEGAWELRVYAGAGQTVTRTFHGTRRQAETALSKLVTEVDSRKVVATRGRTVSLLMWKWFESASPNWSPRTVYEHRRLITKEIVPAIGSLRLSRVNTADVDQFYAALRTRLAPGSVRRIHAVVHSAFEQAVVWGWIGVNPASHARKPVVPEPETTTPTPGDVDRLLEGAKARPSSSPTAPTLVETPEMFAFLALDAAIGARLGQIVALRWSAVDLEAATVRITHTASIGEKGVEITPLTKTKGKARTVAIDDLTVAVLTAHHDAMRARAKSFGVRLGKTAFVFSDDPAGKLPWRPDSTSRRFRKLRDRAGLTGVRFHDIRHYVGTYLINAGVDPRTVADLLGHTKAATTLNMYAHKVRESDRAAVEILAKLRKESDI